MEPEPTKEKGLKWAVSELNPEQREAYDNALNQRRRELQRDSGNQNVAVSERWEILEGVKGGTIKPAKKSTSPLSGIDMGKVKRDFDERPASFIENSLPRGDRD
jgi:hypothetical protein